MFCFRFLPYNSREKLITYLRAVEAMETDTFLLWLPSLFELYCRYTSWAQQTEKKCAGEGLGWCHIGILSKVDISYVRSGTCATTWNMRIVFLADNVTRKFPVECLLNN